MNKKFIATRVPGTIGINSIFVDTEGRKFHRNFYSSDIKVGDKIFMGKRTNSPRHEQIYEIWEFTVEEDSWVRDHDYKNRVKFHYTAGRFLLKQI